MTFFRLYICLVLIATLSGCGGSSRNDSQESTLKNLVQADLRWLEARVLPRLLSRDDQHLALVLKQFMRRPLKEDRLQAFGAGALDEHFVVRGGCFREAKAGNKIKCMAPGKQRYDKYQKLVEPLQEGRVVQTILYAPKKILVVCAPLMLSQRLRGSVCLSFRTADLRTANVSEKQFLSMKLEP